MTSVLRLTTRLLSLTIVGVATTLAVVAADSRHEPDRAERQVFLRSLFT
jgi:hypothetical protein